MFSGNSQRIITYNAVRTRDMMRDNKNCLLTVIHSPLDSHGVSEVGPRHGNPPDGEEVILDAGVL